MNAETHFWSICRGTQVLPNHVCDLLNDSLGHLDTARQTSQDERESKEVVLDLDAGDWVYPCAGCISAQRSMPIYTYRTHRMSSILVTQAPKRPATTFSP